MPLCAPPSTRALPRAVATVLLVGAAAAVAAAGIVAAQSLPWSGGNGVGSNWWWDNGPAASGPAASVGIGGWSYAGRPTHEPATELVLARLSLEEQLRELQQFDIGNILANATINRTMADEGFGYGWINETIVIDLLRRNQVGSLFNSPSSGEGTAVPPVEWWRKLQQRIWNLSRSSAVGGSRVPILYGIDSIHGATYIFNSTLFPQQIGCAATFNTAHAETMGTVSGKETRYAGIPWVFSPVLGIAVQPSWARVFETFGEDPLLASQMGVAVISGYQRRPDPAMFDGASWRPAPGNSDGGGGGGGGGAPASPLPVATPNVTVAACAKHFVAYPDARTGRDRTPVEMPYSTLLQYFLPPFNAAVNDPRARVLSIMENYIEVNGRPVVASELLLNFLLRGQQELNFQGMLVTDYNEVMNLFDFHMYSESYKEAIFDSLNVTSVDMVMLSDPDSFPSVPDTLAGFVRGQRMDPQRLRTSAARVLDLKVRLGLIGSNGRSDDASVASPVPPPQRAWSGSQCSFGCVEHRQAALDAARESITLLQNDNATLPLNFPALRNIAIIGQACDSKGLMSGGWTVHWQGTSNESALPTGATIRQEIERRFGVNGGNGGTANIFYNAGCNVTENSVCGDDFVKRSVLLATSADVVVLCLGERHYAEKPGDIFDLGLPGGQIGLVEALAQAAVPREKIVAVLIEGRPRLLGSVPKRVAAVVHGYLPGPFGGPAIVDVLSGVVNPSGRLPITYPRTYNGAPMQYWRKYSSNTGDDYTGAIQWPFGHGLSYTAFAYSNLVVAISGNNIPVAVDVTNVGARPGREAVLAYSTQAFRRATPEVQMLRAFAKIGLAPGETQRVRMAFSYLELSYFDETNCRRFQSAPVTISVGNLSQTLSFGPLRDVPVDLQTCLDWGHYFVEHQGGPPIFPTNPPSAPSTTQDYLLSSIVCFGAGIVVTVIVVSFIRRRKERALDPNLLEPAGV
jgi:beta-glucosidase